MDYLFDPISFGAIGDVEIQMHLFELTAMVMVILQIWLYGRLSLWGPIWGGVGACMWITMGLMANPPMYGLVILNLFILYLQAFNYIKWSKNKKLEKAAAAQGDAPAA